jgi:hypothetical protein
VAVATQQYWAVGLNAAQVGAVYVAVGAASGGVATQSWSGAAWGAFSALAFNAIGGNFAGGDAWTRAWATKALAHGITGGVMSVLQGGKFGHGFASAGVTQAMSGAIDNIGKGKSSYAPHRVAVAAIVGGTVSVATGGKFASGALTGAFSRAFNDEGIGHAAREDAGIDEFTGQRVVDVVKTYRGAGYFEGGGDRSTTQSMDCSGSVWLAYNEAGLPTAYFDSRSFPQNPVFIKAPGNIPQQGDVGQWNGHVLIYDRNAGGNNNAWSARQAGKPFGPVEFKWWNRLGPVTWYRYRASAVPQVAP